MSEELAISQPQATTERAQLFYKVIGGISVANKIAEAIGSQAMEALKQIQEQKLYLEEGYSDFATFLNESPNSPMSKSEYYRLKELYAKEVPEEFDLLNTVSIPFAKRKLLIAGDVTLDGDQVIVGEKPYQIGDKKGIKKAITRLIENYSSLKNKHKDAEKDIKRLEQERDELKAEAENTAPPPPDETTELGQAFLRLLSSFAQIKNLLGNQKPAQAKGWIAAHRRRVDLAVEDFAEFCNEFVGEDDELTDEELLRIMED